jgi:multidrug efflux pump subunit AcrA (membrane-fusion protein)
MSWRVVLSRLLAFAVVIGVVAAAYLSRGHWLSWLMPTKPDSALAKADDADHAHGPADRLRLSPQARANLKLVTSAIQPETFWRTLIIPGQVIDQPGQSDRGVTSPIAGVVKQVFVRPGDTVRAGERLFSIQLVSESVQTSQTELFKTNREIEFTQEQKARLSASSAVPAVRIQELDLQERRFQATARAYRQDLLARGFTPDQVRSAGDGNFITEITVVAPQPATDDRNLVVSAGIVTTSNPSTPVLEVQDLKVNLGEQVQAGQTLGFLANHQDLMIEGRAFKQESPLLARAAEQGWPVRVEFAEDDPSGWPRFDGVLKIRHLANNVDPVSRTFGFYLSLANQVRAYSQNGRTFLIWRFRPGQRVQLHIPTEKLDNVFVLPAGAVVREGPDAFVFRQNGDAFDRRPVHIVHEDRSHVVAANDGSLSPGLHVARNGAAALNRALKAQQSAGESHGHDHSGHSHDH